MVWLVLPAAAPTGAWTQQGQRRIGDAAGGTNEKLTGKLGFQAIRWNALLGVLIFGLDRSVK
jgi:hypothetical protein